MAEEITPLSSMQPTLVELADAVRQLQRTLAPDPVDPVEPFDPTEILTRLAAVESKNTQQDTRLTTLEEAIENLLTMTVTGNTTGVVKFTMGGVNFKLVYGTWDAPSGTSSQAWHQPFTGQVRFAFENQKESGGNETIRLYAWTNAGCTVRNGNGSSRTINYIAGGVDS